MKKKILLKGFTLIELIVVLAIIGVLAAMIIPSLIGYIRKAKRTADISAGKTIGKEINSLIYSDDEAYELFYARKGSQFNQNGFRVVHDNDGNQYKLVAIAKISGTKKAHQASTRKWVAFDTTEENGYAKFVKKLNVSMCLGNEEVNIPMKYDPPSPISGKNLNADTWFVGYNLETQDVEVWVGDSHGQWGFEAMYCLYPYISNGY